MSTRTGPRPVFPYEEEDLGVFYALRKLGQWAEEEERASQPQFPDLPEEEKDQIGMQFDAELQPRIDELSRLRGQVRKALQNAYDLVDEYRRKLNRLVVFVKSSEAMQVAELKNQAIELLRKLDADRFNVVHTIADSSWDLATPN